VRFDVRTVVFNCCDVGSKGDCTAYSVLMAAKARVWLMTVSSREVLESSTVSAIFSAYYGNF